MPNWEIEKAFFTGSFVHYKDCPEADKPEYAFIGRSNVGKSSLINMLTKQKKLAKTSGRPGKTQTINYFTIQNQNSDGKSWFLVDLPGYGYAQVSKTQRKKWERFIRDYLVKRTSLQCVMMLVDSRVPPQQIDLEFANWMGEIHIPFVIVYTKADKNKPDKLAANIAAFEKAMLKTWNTMPQQFVTSATKADGREDVLAFIQEVNSKFVSL